MCFLIAKKFDEPGCIAVETESGKELASLVSYLGKKTLEKNIQILTVSNPEIYGEYKPYHMLKTKNEFINKVLSM